jgi:hypothetical protein
MDKQSIANARKEWLQILQAHPTFARVFLAQQLMLVEASEREDSRLIKIGMCKLVDLGLVFPFAGYWLRRCRKVVVPGGIWECLLKSKNPADCFNIPEEVDWGWFDPPVRGWEGPQGPLPEPEPLAR